MDSDGRRIERRWQPRPHPEEKQAPREAAQHLPSKPLTTGEVLMASSDRIRSQGRIAKGGLR
jgi:hypothetical protein